MELEKVDVIICGSGSAGLSAAIWLARFGINFKLLERRDGPLQIGQADGVQCRTVEIFESLGISEPLLKESYHVLEIAFWSEDAVSGGIQLQQTKPDTEPGLSHQPHVILNQARINEIMIEEIVRLRQGNGAGIEYSCTAEDVRITNVDEEYPIEVVAAKNGVRSTLRAKYVIGCDGAHSTVRKCLGFHMVGDSSDSTWGVIDLHPRTDFPDIRRKTVIQSVSGNLMIIPREGDSLVRFYIELPGKSAGEVTEKYLLDRVCQIFQPFKMESAKTIWWSAYVIGQRVASEFTQDRRVFLAGDACHTHSPKAGQGMNVSLQDGFNIGWKLGHILTNRAPESLLKTYVLEREQTARELIAFDQQWSKLFSTTYRKENGINPEQLQEEFTKAGRYTAGLATKYGRSVLTREDKNSTELCSGLQVGTRLPSAPVVRLCDGKRIQVAQAVPSDGRWHLIVFSSGKSEKSMEQLHQFAATLADIIKNYTTEEQDSNSVINAIIVAPGSGEPLTMSDIPDLFKPRVGELQTRLLTNVFVDEAGYGILPSTNSIFRQFGINKAVGALVLVRPDIYLSSVLSIGDEHSVRNFFEGCLLPRRDSTQHTAL